MRWPPFVVLVLVGCPAPDDAPSDTTQSAASSGEDTEAHGSSEPGTSNVDPSTSTSSTGEPIASTGGSTDVEESSTGVPIDDTSTGEEPVVPFGHSVGCGTQPGSITSGMIVSAGLDREYILQLPEGYDPNKAYPLVFAYHGFNENMDTALARFRVVQEWDGEAIGIYPNGRVLPQYGGMAFQHGSPNSPDIAFFDDLATIAAEQLCVDLDRIFAMGFSNGGYFVHSLMCFRGQYLRASAPSGAGMSGTANGDNCGGPEPMWSAHATNDEVVPYGAAVQMRNYWLARAGCSDETMPIDPADLCVEHQGCGEHPIVTCDFDMGHWYMEDWKNPAATTFFQRFETLTP